MIIPDFQNLYTNKSYLSREEQVALFRKVIRTIRTLIPNASDQYMQVSLHGLLFSLLSETDFNETVFMIADPVCNQLLANYAELLRPEHIIVISDLDERLDYHSQGFHNTMLDYFDQLMQELKRQFSIMVFPYGMLEGDIENWLKYFDDMLSYGGKIILYDCPDHVSCDSNFELVADHKISEGYTIKVFRTKKEFSPSEVNKSVMNQIRIWIKETEDLSRRMLCEQTIMDTDIRLLDKLIMDARYIEGQLIQYHDEFPDGDIRYRINEIMNALLDIRYSDDKDMAYFTERLKEEQFYLNNMIS